MSVDLIRPTEGTLGLDQNQVQLALAIADVDMLKTLLTGCTPAIAQPHQIGQVRVAVGKPPGTVGLEDLTAVMEYERVWCVLAEEAPEIATQSCRDYQYLTRCHSGLQTLAWRVSLSEAVSLLSYGGFQEKHIQRILQLPRDGWHRSWWDTLDAQGQLGLPFQRRFRTRCYSDGTYTLQYQNLYAQDAPPCFRAIWQQVPLMVTRPDRQFGETLSAMRKAQHMLKAQNCMLLTGNISQMEIEGYIRQGVSLHPIQGSPELA